MKFRILHSVFCILHLRSRSGVTLIGIIAAIVVMGLLGAGVLMLVSVGSMESIQTLKWDQAFFAAESGISAGRNYIGSHTNWATNAPLTITGMVGQASFTAVLGTNTVITSVGRQIEAQWTSVWKGTTTGGVLVLWCTNGNIVHKLADFPGNEGDCGQSFTTLSNAISVSRIEIEGRKDSQNCSDIYMTIRSGSTVGPIIGTSEIVLSDDIPKPQEDWFAFTFSTPVALAANTTYYMRLESVPPSTDPWGDAKGRLWWVYSHSAWSPPAYAGGDAWRYIGRDNDPNYPGQQLGPSDQYDYNFRIYD